MSTFLPMYNPLAILGTNLKSEFIKDYASYAAEYDAIDVMGNQTFKTTWPYIVSAIGIIVMIIFFVMGMEKVDPVTKQPIPKTTMQPIYTYIGWFLLCCSLFGFGYGLYLYFAIFSPQYNEWYDSLPSTAKIELASINQLDAIEAERRQLENERFNNINKLNK
jgi:hypothetical protein